jgi:hypothetical protein
VVADLQHVDRRQAAPHERLLHGHFRVAGEEGGESAAAHRRHDGAVVDVVVGERARCVGG